MTYKINKTDGSLIAEVIDSAIDQTTIDITLIGKNVSGYGEFINENFVKILENFANTSQPNNPLAGQLWFDTSENRLKVYDGFGFKNGSGPIVSGTAPTTAIQGDFWIDSAENQLYFYTGAASRHPASKIWKDSQGISGFEVDTIYDTNNAPRVILKLWVATTLLGIFSKYAIPFTPRDGTSGLSGFTGTISPGFNQGTLSGMKFHVTATTANALLDAYGNSKTVENFIATSGTSTIATDINGFGTLVIQNGTPLILGPSANSEIRVDNNAFQIVSNNSGQNFLLKVKNSSGLVDAITVNSLNERVGIFNNAPTVTLDVNGDVLISGDLTVNGATTTISTSELTVEDKNIIIANVGSPTNITASGAGITIRGTTNKTIAWNDHTSYTSFDISESINLAVGKSLYINGTEILNSTGLSAAITSAPGIISFGPQIEVTVDNLYLNNNRLSSLDTDGNIELAPDGTGNVVLIGSPKITGLADPTSNQDAATKIWTETYTRARTIPLSLDITGLNSAGIAAVLDDIAPTSYYEEGTRARIHCTAQVITYPAVSLTNSTSPVTTGDFVKHYVAVDKNLGNQNQPVLEDFDINSLNLGSATVTVTRSLMIFEIQSSLWTDITGP